MPPTGQSTAFYCNALQGESNYNICINCDMTVSCNCQDYDGSGHIGDLRTHTFAEVFRGGTAQRFRETLARGGYPASLCPRCSELRRGHTQDEGLYVLGFALPHKGIMVENTILCNLRCQFCSRRTTQGLRRQVQMSLGDMEFTAKTLRDVGIAQVFFHNLGEPFVSAAFHHEVALLQVYNPHLQMYVSTNGVLLDSASKVRAATAFHHIYFSIDGPSQEVLIKYQVGGDFAKSYANMRRVVDARNAQGNTTPTIEWKYVLFNWNDNDAEIANAVELARSAGVDLISFTTGGAPDQYRSHRQLAPVFFPYSGSARTLNRTEASSPDPPPSGRRPRPVTGYLQP